MNTGLASAGTLLQLRRNVGLIGAHWSMITAAIGLSFLQGYIWQVRLAEIGYGPYLSTPYLIQLSLFVVMVDLFVLWRALGGSQTAKTLSLLWPALWFTSSVVVIVANNL